MKHTNLDTAKQLGYNFAIFHGRIPTDVKGMKKDHITYHHLTDPDPFGGETLAYVWDDKGNSALGIAPCFHHDRFNKKDGINLAIGRALKKLKVS